MTREPTETWVLTAEGKRKVSVPWWQSDGSGFFFFLGRGGMGQNLSKSLLRVVPYPGHLPQALPAPLSGFFLGCWFLSVSPYSCLGV